MATTARRAGIAGAAVGVIAAGAAVGFAVERATIGRAVRRLAEPRGLVEPYGTLRGRPLTVRAEDGVGLYVEVDGPDQFSSGAGWARRRTGTASGKPTLVFCHGYALNQDTWHYQRAEFSRDHRCVFWDQRSHGRSERGTPASCTVDQTGRDLFAVLDAVCPDGPVILIGHSMGGMTIMSLAAEHPELFGDRKRVRGVVLASTTSSQWREVTLGLPAAAAKLLQQTVPQLFSVLGRNGKLVDRGRRAGSDLAQLLTRRYAFASDVPPALVRFTDEMITSTPMEVIADFFPTLAAHDKAGALPVLGDIPTEVIVGDHDLVTPQVHSADIVEAINASHPLHVAGLEVVQHGGHVLPLEHPEEVDAAVRRVLDRASGSSR